MLAQWGPKPMLEPVPAQAAKLRTAVKSKAAPPPAEAAKKMQEDEEGPVKTDPYQREPWVGGWFPVLWDPYMEQ